MVKKEKQKNKGGRPSKYLSKYATDAFVDEYFAVCKRDTGIETITGTAPDGTTVVLGTKKRLRLPSVEDLSIYLNVSRDSLYEWGRVKPGFSDTLHKIEVKQKAILFEGGVLGEFNPMITKLILSNNHKMSDKLDSKTTIEDKNGVLRQLFDRTVGNEEDDDA